MYLLKLLAKLSQLWRSWNLRSFALFSFSLQCILILGSSLRIQTSNSLVHRLIWLAYLLADWAAYYAIGLIIPGWALDKNMYEIHAFWGPFLLLHIGGPNTIAGFALEDNDLWDRSVLHIIVQAGATGVVIYRSLPRNRLLAPTLLMFLAALTRYVGRILALYNASPDAFQSSVKKERSAPNESHGSNRNENQEDEQNYHVKMVTSSYNRFQKHKGIFCGLSMSSVDEVTQSRLLRQREIVTFTEMEIELGIAYNVFYTKVWLIIEDKVGKILHLLSLLSEIVALILWALADKRWYHKVDIRVTNTLVVGGIVVDVASCLKLLFSDIMVTHLLRWFGKYQVAYVLNKLLLARNHKWARYLVVFRRWSVSIKMFNLSRYKDHQSKLTLSKKLAEKLIRLITGIDKYVSSAKITDEMKRHIVRNLKTRALFWKSSSRETERSGMLAEYISEMYGLEEIQEIFKVLGPVDTLLFWHTTTDLFYSQKGQCMDEEQSNEEEDRKFLHGANAQLSEYLMYLLFCQPKMILEGIGADKTVEDMMTHLDEIREGEHMHVDLHINFEDADSIRGVMEGVATDEMVENMMKKLEEIRQRAYINVDEEMTLYILSVYLKNLPGKKGERTLKHILQLARITIHYLNSLNQDESERIINEIWIDFLFYVAIRCKARTHVQQLGKGGELVNVLWLLMSYLG